MLRETLISLVLISAIPLCLSAQNDDRGTFSAGLETNTTYYFNDSGTGASAPDGRMGSNNYLKMDYSWKGFSAGLQLEGYLPAIIGYFPAKWKSENFMRYDFYAGYTGGGWDVRLGSLFEQFGSGLLLRTYEDRTLGINNALQGIRVGYTFGDFLSIRAIYGRVRDIKEYTGAMVSGADLSLSISRAAKWEKVDWAVEGSIVDNTRPWLTMPSPGQCRTTPATRSGQHSATPASGSAGNIWSAGAIPASTTEWTPLPAAHSR